MTSQRHRRVAQPRALRAMPRDRDHPAAKALQAPRNFFADPAVTQNQHGALPQGVAHRRAQLALLKLLHGLRQLAGQHQQQGDSQLRHRLGIAAAHAGHVSHRNAGARGGRQVDHVEPHAVLLDQAQARRGQGFVGNARDERDEHVHRRRCLHDVLRGAVDQFVIRQRLAQQIENALVAAHAQANPQPGRGAHASRPAPARKPTIAATVPAASRSGSKFAPLITTAVASGRRPFARSK